MVLNKILRISNSTDEEIHDLIDFAHRKFAAEPCPFGRALRPIRDAIAKLDPNPSPCRYASLTAKPGAD